MYLAYSGSSTDCIRFTDVWYVELNWELSNIIDVDYRRGGGGARGGA